MTECLNITIAAGVAVYAAWCYGAKFVRSQTVQLRYMCKYMDFRNEAFCHDGTMGLFTVGVNVYSFCLNHPFPSK